MSLGTATDVAIGMIFVYLLLSLIATAAQEVFARVVNKRGAELQRGLEDLLAGDRLGPTIALFQQVWTHPLVQNGSVGRKPAYVAAANFSGALFHVLMDGSTAPAFSAIEQKVAILPDGTLKQSMSALLIKAGGDIEALRNSVEEWFDNAMDRASGTYKRWGQYFTLGFGLFVAVALNVDSIRLANVLWTNSALRTSIVTAAIPYAEQNKSTGKFAPNSPEAPLNDAQAKAALPILNELQLPIGWNAKDKPVWKQVYETLYRRDFSVVVTLLGWLITALAVSLGAPFWFDMLNSFINMRAAGPKPPPAADARSRPGGG